MVNRNNAIQSSLKESGLARLEGRKVFGKIIVTF